MVNKILSYTLILITISALLFIGKAGAETQLPAVYKLEPKYLVTDFNSQMIASTITQDQNTFSLQGNFRTNGDLAGMSWEVNDNYSHPAFKYPTNPDFSSVKLRYDYTISGYTQPMNSSQAPSLTIETNDGQTYIVRLWNYVINRPVDNWEAGSGTLFPQNRSSGSASGLKGTIEIDFDNLYAGWAPYTWVPAKLDKGKVIQPAQWKLDPSWKKVPVNKIKKIMWAFVPEGYTGGTKTLGDSKQFEVYFNNWNVSGNTFLDYEKQALPPTSVRLCDDYDDVYNLTPERIVSEYDKLGYSGMVDFYIGASHYYDKLSGVMKTGYPFNYAFEKWYADYVKRLKEKDIQLVQSISMENVDAPSDWWQRTWNGKAATTGWTPAPHLLSFTNQNVKSFYKLCILNLANIADKNGMKPVVQLGEPWWWFDESTKDQPPCFYDKATKQLFLKEKGYSMHVFKSSHEALKGYEDMLYWLRDKNGQFTLFLRDALKQKYPSAQFTVLFFPPSVTDKDRVPAMMSTVNFPKNQWKYPNLDFFMLEDYDYLIAGQMDKHNSELTFVQKNLGYPSGKIDYISGYVQNKNNKAVWNNIDQAIKDGFNQNFRNTYVWAYSQIRRDGWIPPAAVISNKP
ncbi:MAG: hypothetical protein Q8920_08985 [Bacillota bacterium]|nr:hypothetical protein [Bacillota bacterium]